MLETLQVFSGSFLPSGRVLRSVIVSADFLMAVLCNNRKGAPCKGFGLPLPHILQEKC